MRKELSPLSCRSHMVYDVATQLFVFGDGIRFIEYAVMLMRVKSDTSKTVRAILAVRRIKNILYILKNWKTKQNMIGIMSKTRALIGPFRMPSKWWDIHTIISCFNCIAVSQILWFWTFKTVITVIGIDEVVSEWIFCFEKVQIFFYLLGRPLFCNMRYV